MMTLTVTGETKASLEQLMDVLLAPELVQRISGSRVDQMDPTWPAVGSTMVIKAMGMMRLEARIVERTPDLLVQTVRAGKATNTIRHRLTALPTGGTRLEKTIEMADGWMNRVMAALMLRRQLRKEVDGTLAAADEVAEGRLQVSARPGHV